jgi:beta-lactamase class A
MRRMVMLLCAVVAAAPAGPAVAQDEGLERLRAELARLAPIAQGTMGVGVLHLESGRSLFLNADAGFPMASTVKVPIAVQLLHMVDQGRLRLDSMIVVEQADLHPGSGTLTRLFDDPGVVLSVRNLMELMLLISDNSATDILLRVAGGGAAVNARLAALGVSGISVDRPTIELIGDAIGVSGLPPRAERTPATFGALSRALTDEQRRAAATAFYTDPRDTATPRGMTRLLEMIWKRQALSESSSALLLDIMYRCETGENRLKGLLPPQTAVAHKTGSLGIGVANDVGIIDLPGGAGHVIVAAFVKESKGPVQRQELGIAQVARAVHDYFVFNR